MLYLVQDGDRILLQNRVKNDWQGYTLPGGHVEHEENAVTCYVDSTAVYRTVRTVVCEDGGH